MKNAGSFFSFMEKREKLRLAKEAGQPFPWSDDWILNTYKFTNVKREHDRTTRWMRAHWTGPRDNAPWGDIIFNCALFRYFGTAEFAEAIGWQEPWDSVRVAAVAERRHRLGERVFTGAYIIPTLGFRGPKHIAVCKHILTPLWAEREFLAHIARETKSWRKVGEYLMRLPGFGGFGFMAKETLQDVMQTPVLRDAHDRNTWCPAGPGARRGLNRVFGRPVNSHLSFDSALREMIALFDGGNRALGAWMPRLELHDIQFQLCEFDKYERVRLGEGRPKAKYHLPV